ncbi:TolC family protein [Planctomycetota bacterium]|nr:TolC family protein [Planctomycetota bacterium]MDC0347181.1 TolC family protein [Planctomycetota bacterium]
MIEPRTLSHFPFKCRNIIPILVVSFILGIPQSGMTQDTSIFSADEQLELSLVEAIQLALEHNLGLQVQRVSEAKALLDPIISEAAFDPLFSTGFTLSDSETTSTSIIDGAAVGETSKRSNDSYFLGLSGLMRYGTTWQFRLSGDRSETSADNPFFSPLNYRSGYQLSLSQPLLKGFGRSITETSLRVALRNAESSKLATVRAMETTVANIENSYWDLVYARQNVEVQRSGLQEAQELLDLNRRRLEVELGTRLDVISAEANVETQKSSIIAALNNLRDLQDVLLDSINAPQFRREGDISTMLKDVEVIPTTPLDQAQFSPNLEEVVKEALTSRLELLQQDLQIASSEDILRLREDEMRPSLNFSGSFNQPGNGLELGESWSNIGEDFSWSAGLNLEIPLGQRSARNRQLQASEDLRLAQLGRTQQSHIIVLEVTRAVRELDSARQAVGTTQAATRLRREELDGETRRLEVGVSTAYQVLQVQNSLLTAQVQRLQAQVRLRKAITGYRNSTGRILNDYGIKIGEVLEN